MLNALVTGHRDTETQSLEIARASIVAVVLSNAQIDKLGERLKTGDPTESDLRELDEYRRSFVPVHDQVVATIRTTLKIEPTGRVPKSIPSIVAKLRRESVRLSQIQDIAGCRIVVADLEQQDEVVAQD